MPFVSVHIIPIQVPTSTVLHCGPKATSIPLFVVHNVHVYVGIPGYLQETFETHKVSAALDHVVVMPDCTHAEVVQPMWSTLLSERCVCQLWGDPGG